MLKALDSDCEAAEGSDREAVPGEMAQPPEPGHQEDCLDRRGGQSDLQRAQAVGKPVGQDCKAGPRQNRQCHKKPLELHHETEV